MNTEQTTAQINAAQQSDPDRDDNRKENGNPDGEPLSHYQLCKIALQIRDALDDVHSKASVARLAVIGMDAEESEDVAHVLLFDVCNPLYSISSRLGTALADTKSPKP